MGRSGGGGGSRSSGGGRSSGGHSGGGRSGGSGRSSGRSGNYSGGRSSMNSGGYSRGAGRPGGPTGPVGGPRRNPRPRRRYVFFGPRYYDDRPGQGFGRFGTCLILLFIVAFLSIAFNSAQQGSNRGATSSSITTSSIEREKLNTDVNLSAGYYTDESGWINNSSQLESGLKSFYNETGIAPYVYIIDNIDGNYYPSTEELETFAEEQYETLFTDEAHILLVFWDYDGYYEYTLWLGAQTGTIMDSEACDILFDYLDYYYYAADTDEHFFSYAFEKAGERIMTVTTPAWIKAVRTVAVVVIVLAGVGIVVIVYKWWEKSQEKKAEEDRRAQEILNTPLEKFGDPKAEDLAEKYKDINNNDQKQGGV